MLIDSLRKAYRLGQRALVGAAREPVDQADDAPVPGQDAPVPDRDAPAPDQAEAPPAHSYAAYVEEISAVHAHGVARDLLHPDARLECEAFLPGTGEVIGHGRADQFKHGLHAAGLGDGSNAFWLRFDRTLDERERATVRLRVRGDGHEIFVPPSHKTTHEPILHVAMDIVDNCNLRCPFCLYDYSDTRTTHLMERDTLLAALRFLPLTRDGEFWFSCLHEPALHPDLRGFIDAVPPELRRKVFFTTNIAKRMPQEYFDWLAASGIDHINVSIESRTPAIYEKMRKGARFRIFQENWDRLMVSLERTANPIKIRYIAMAYKSNLRELPDLARHLLEERHATQVEIRYTYDVPFIPGPFRESEFLDAADWAWLADQCSGFSPHQLALLQPPPSDLPAPDLPPSDPPAPNLHAPDLHAPDLPAVSADPAGPQPASPEPGPTRTLPGRYMFRLSWDGTLNVVGLSTASHHDCAVEHVITRTNIRDIEDPAAFLDRLDAGTAAEGLAS